jgi:hypothetical protein
MDIRRRGREGEKERGGEGNAGGEESYQAAYGAGGV